MDNLECITLESNEPQESALNLLRRQTSKEIVRSAAMPRAHYFSPRFKRHSVFAQELSQRDRLTTLCAQLQLLRLRLMAGIPVTVDDVARTERLARSLELAA